jgi:hypothetical protein
MRGIAGGSFRANPRYRLVPLERLTPTERQALGDVGGDPDLYGVLRPEPGSGLQPRSLSCETALLFLTLAEPGPVPAYAVARLGDELERTIGRMVLDAVLEVERDGEFVGGARAGELVAPERASGGRGRIAELSRAALRYGQALVGVSEPELAMRLYLYGRRPASPALRRRLADEAAVAAYLGVGPGGSAREALEEGWRELPLANGGPSGWRQWRALPTTRRETEPAGAAYKLYVSPAIEGLEAAVGVVASSLATAVGVSAFKVGRDLRGICRPDKLVVYFDRLDDLQAGAAVLRERLPGCPAHGVPFTAAITRDGLLSWGADPPVRPSADGAGGASWRMWVTERLAEYLTVARDAGPGGLEPWQFALERLRLSGVDTDTWVPAGGMWPEALATG